MKPLLAATIVLAVTGCTSAPPIDYATMDPVGVAAATTVKGSKFDKVTSIEGPAIKTRRKLPSAPGQMVDHYESRWVFLRGAVAKGTPTTHSVYVEIQYEGNGWKFYDGANFEGGVRATFLPIARKVVDCYPSLCTYSEAFAVLLREADVRGKGDIEFALRSRSGTDDVITLPRNYINGYLSAVDR